MINSSASPEEIETYTAGECHVLAVALHRMFGWHIEIIRADEEVWWQDEQDPDNFIPAVLHAYAIDPDDNAWDIRGVRPASLIHADCLEHFGMDELSGDTCRGEGEVKTYVGVLETEEDGEVELPLGAYSDADVQDAAAIAMKVLSRLPGFPSPQPPARPPRP